MSSRTVNLAILFDPTPGPTSENDRARSRATLSRHSLIRPQPTPALLHPSLLPLPFRCRSLEISVTTGGTVRSPGSGAAIVALAASLPRPEDYRFQYFCKPDIVQSPPRSIARATVISASSVRNNRARIKGWRVSDFFCPSPSFGRRRRPAAKGLERVREAQASFPDMRC